MFVKNLLKPTATALSRFYYSFKNKPVASSVEKEKAAPAEQSIKITFSMLPHLKVLGIDLTSGELLHLSVVKAAYRSLALTAHPDKGGTQEGFCLIQEAAESLITMISSPGDGDLANLLAEIRAGAAEIRAGVAKLNNDMDALEKDMSSLADSQTKTLERIDQLDAAYHERAVSNADELTEKFKLHEATMRAKFAELLAACQTQQEVTEPAANIVAIRQHNPNKSEQDGFKSLSMAMVLSLCEHGKKVTATGGYFNSLLVQLMGLNQLLYEASLRYPNRIRTLTVNTLINQENSTMCIFFNRNKKPLPALEVHARFQSTSSLPIRNTEDTKTCIISRL